MNYKSKAEFKLAYGNFRYQRNIIVKRICSQEINGSELVEFNKKHSQLAKIYQKREKYKHMCWLMGHPTLEKIFNERGPIAMCEFKDKLHKSKQYRESIDLCNEVIKRIKNKNKKFYDHCLQQNHIIDPLLDF